MAVYVTDIAPDNPVHFWVTIKDNVVMRHEFLEGYWYEENTWDLIYNRIQMNRHEQGNITLEEAQLLVDERLNKGARLLMKGSRIGKSYVDQKDFDSFVERAYVPV